MTEEQELASAELALRWAVAAAGKSRCAKSQRGVVIWLPGQDVLMATGANRPAKGFACTGSAACRTHCAELCVHAEADALRRIGQRWWPRLPRLHLLHVKVRDGQAVRSGGPSCCSCSGLICAEPAIDAVWLYQATGLRRYEPTEFHRLALLGNGYDVDADRRLA